MEEVHLISTSLVTPSNNHPNSNNLSIPSIDLNSWDLQMIHFKGIQKGLFFSNPSNTQLQTLKQHFPTENLIQHLKVSLSHTLSFFPPLAGRFSASKNDDNTTSFSINCNNEGAEFTHAIAKGVSIANVLDPTTYTPQIVPSLFPLNEVMNYEGLYKPLFGAQITDLEDGIFIGCTMNHCLGDGTAFWDFFNSWSEISRGLSSISKTPVFSRWFPDDLTNFSSVQISLPEKQTEQKLNPLNNTPIIQEKVFHFTKENIAKLKSKANLENTTETTISSFQALVSHLWRSVIRCCKLENPNQDVCIMLAVNARGRIQPFLPDGYFGNAIPLTSLKTTAKNLLENPLSWAALELNKVIASHTSDSIKNGYIDLMNTQKVMNMTTLPQEDYSIEGSALLILSSARHRVYTVDFGWGKTLAVRSGGGNRIGKFTVFPGREEGSIEFHVCLSLETFTALENDEEFMEVLKL